MLHAYNFNRFSWRDLAWISEYLWARENQFLLKNLWEVIVLAGLLQSIRKPFRSFVAIPRRDIKPLINSSTMLFTLKVVAVTTRVIFGSICLIFRELLEIAIDDLLKLVYRTFTIASIFPLDPFYILAHNHRCSSRAAHHFIVFFYLFLYIPAQYITISTKFHRN